MSVSLTQTPVVRVSATVAAAVVPATSTPKPSMTPTAKLEATPTPGSPSVGDATTRVTDGMTLVYVPAGTFSMGSNDGNDNERPVRDVTLDALWLDQTEVTNAQYNKCVDAGVCDPHCTSGKATSMVTSIRWLVYPGPMGGAYCIWTGGRFLTEAEWEYAARGPENRVYPWGDETLKGYANCIESDCGDGFAYIAPVGSFSQGASWVGALDMAGNVWEWVNDWHQDDYYSVSPARDPSGPASGSSRVVRGGGWDGSWHDNWRDLRAASRVNLVSTLRSYFGFRCAGGAPGVILEGQVHRVHGRGAGQNLASRRGVGAATRTGESTGILIGRWWLLVPPSTPAGSSLSQRICRVPTSRRPKQ